MSDFNFCISTYPSIFVLLVCFLKFALISVKLYEKNVENVILVQIFQLTIEGHP